MIDDEPLIGTLIARLLSEAHDVTSLTNARHGLLLLAKDDPFDVVLCDLLMPGMNGSAFFTQLAQRSPAIANGVVFMTGGACTAELRDFVQRVPNIVLEKPLDFGRLEMLVDRRVRARPKLRGTGTHERRL